MELILKCKDFDAYVSFLGRLNKIGSNFVIKNDIVFPVTKGVKSGTTENIPGRHLTRDPLFINDESAYEPNILYIPVLSIDRMISCLKEFKTNKEARKKIVLIRTKEGVSIQFNGLQPMMLFVNEKLWKFDDTIPYHQTTAHLTWFNDYLNTPNNWIPIETKDLVNLRNNGLMVIRQEINGLKLWSRIARSIFIMSGVSRMDTPLAKHVEYTFIHSDTIQTDTAVMRLHARYNEPGGSNLITVECVHEYVILVYDEGE